MDSLCYRAGKKSYIISTYNLAESLEKIASKELKFRVILDRATDCSPAFIPLVHLLQEQGSQIINNPAKVARTCNKALMHLEFLNAGLDVPKTILFYPTDKIDEKLLDSVGSSFVIKPAHGAGGEGVVLGAQTIYDVVKARGEHSEDIILVQEKVVPRSFEGKRCWFRVFFISNKVISCFWDDQTHFYQRFTPSEEKIFRDLAKIARKAHEIAELEFFSMEIAQIEDGRFVVVDYVNDQCDLRFQSDTPDGVPDTVVEEIAQAIVDSL